MHTADLSRSARIRLVQIIVIITLLIVVVLVLSLVLLLLLYLTSYGHTDKEVIGPGSERVQRLNFFYTMQDVVLLFICLLLFSFCLCFFALLF